jgi:diguanylate cyclase (GGDEF)-like protein
MSTPAAPVAQDEFLVRLLAVVDRIANEGDLHAVEPLLEMTSAHSQSPILTALAESFARMVVKLEAREYELECTISDLQAAKTELERANFDPLTGLPNRVIARDRLHQGLLQARRSAGQLAVMYLDLDKFKWVNDNLGHAAGDELLQQVAARCKACIRDSDTFARLGGDEFLCVLPSLDSQQAAEELAQRFVDTLNQPFQLRDGEARIGTSVGISMYPAHGTTAEQLIEFADAALYFAKHAGRNVYRVFQVTEAAA